MHHNFLKLGLLSFTLLLTSATAASAASLELFGDPIQEVVDTTSDIPVNTGGSNANFPSSAPVGSFAQFRVRKEGETDEFAQLRITYSGDNGVTDNKVMIAQTSDSQGLTDTGTASILLTLDQDAGSGDFTFNWYEPASGTSTTPKDLDVLYTTYDLDFNQQISFDSSEAQSITLDGSTKLTSTIDSTTEVYDGANSNSSFNEPKNAVQILSENSASHTFSVGKHTGSGNALYMFEFRDPSNNISFTNPNTQQVPFEFSPSLGLVVCGGLFGANKLRKRIAS